MNDIVQFDFNGIAMQGILINDEPWFIAKPIAEALEYRDAPTMTRNLDDDEISNTHEMCIRIPGAPNRGLTVISESGLYSAIMKSRSESAKPFRKKVTSEILPQIRKTGQYSVQQLSQAEMFLQSAKMMVEQEKRLNAIQAQQDEQRILLDKKASLDDVKEMINGIEVANEKPAGSESLTQVRKRMNEKYGLSAVTVNKALEYCSAPPTIYRMVRNTNENANNETYAVYRVCNVTEFFKRFVKECEVVGKNRATHHAFDGKFKLIK